MTGRSRGCLGKKPLLHSSIDLEHAMKRVIEIRSAEGGDDSKLFSKDLASHTSSSPAAWAESTACWILAKVRFPLRWKARISQSSITNKVGIAFSVFLQPNAEGVYTRLR